MLYKIDCFTRGTLHRAEMQRGEWPSIWHAFDELYVKGLVPFAAWYYDPTKAPFGTSWFKEQPGVLIDALRVVVHSGVLPLMNRPTVSI